MVQKRFGHQIKHAWTNVSHNPSDFFSLNLVIAMHLASTARGLFISERAFSEPLRGIAQDFIAACANRRAMVLFPAVSPNHEINGLQLATNSGLHF
jgi:hypothetical protein